MKKQSDKMVRSTERACLCPGCPANRLSQADQKPEVAAKKPKDRLQAKK